MKIGYIGASGLMGHGMAKNLLAKGQQLSITVHKQRDRVQDLLDAGAQLVATPADLGAQCDVVLVCVTGSPQVEAVVSGPSGLLTHAKAGLVIVDCSTSEPASTAQLRELAHAKGVTWWMRRSRVPLSRPRQAGSTSWWARALTCLPSSNLF